ncbi:MAG: K(+)-transporting ATPase subunit F [Bacteroidota bacterium]
MKRSKPENMIALFIIAILVFCYICYVLVKPEKF